MRVAKALAVQHINAGSTKPSLLDNVINTHYYNSNLIWRTLSCQVDEVIPLDHPRREADGMTSIQGQVTMIIICLLYTLFLTKF